MNKLIYFIGGIILIILIWINLPIRVKYYKEITIGNNFAKNIREYNKRNKALPDRNNSELLMKLNPETGYEVFWPFYLPEDSVNFTLTFIEGFDGPYLTYDSKNDAWKVK